MPSQPRALLCVPFDPASDHPPIFRSFVLALFFLESLSPFLLYRSFLNVYVQKKRVFTFGTFSELMMVAGIDSFLYLFSSLFSLLFMIKFIIIYELEIKEYLKSTCLV